MKIQKRRKSEGKTNYKKRISLLKSGQPRLVFRKTNRYIVTQYVRSKEAQDKVILGVNSRNLSEYGWPKKSSGSLKSIPAAYLIGFLMGKRIQKEKFETPIADSGMTRTIHRNKFFAFLKGVKDSGVEIKCDEKAFPGEERIKGKHLKEDFSKSFEEIKSNIEKKY